MEKKEVKAQMFIIPNSIIDMKGQFEWERKYNNKHESQTELALRNLFPGIEFPEDDKLVEIWVHDEVSDNWNCHGRKVEEWDKATVEEFIERTGVKTGEELMELWVSNTRFPRWLPLSQLKSIKEGDTVKVNYKGLDVILEASQLTGRYRGFGRFEIVLKKLLDRAGLE